MGRRRGLVTSALVALACAAAGTAGADEAGDGRFGRGKQHLGLQVGYGSGLSLSSSRDGPDVEYLAVVPRWSVGLTDPLAEHSWLHGNLDLLVEGSFQVNFEPRSGHFAGGSLLLRYNFLSWERLVPYVEVGAGMGGLDFDLRDQADGFSFVVQGGLGLHWFVTERTSLDAGWRLHHISNAGIRHPNLGIDSSLALFGFTVHLD